MLLHSDKDLRPVHFGSILASASFGLASEVWLIKPKRSLATDPYMEGRFPKIMKIVVTLKAEY